MDTTKIIQLKLTKESLVPFEILEDYNVVLINKENYNNYIHELLYVSDLMKRDFDWVGIPDELIIGVQSYLKPELEPIIAQFYERVRGSH